MLISLTPKTVHRAKPSQRVCSPNHPALKGEKEVRAVFVISSKILELSLLMILLKTLKRVGILVVFPYP